MDEETRETLRTLLVAQVLTLAKGIETEKRANGTVMGNFIGDAVREISLKRAEVLRRLAGTM